MDLHSNEYHINRKLARFKFGAFSCNIIWALYYKLWLFFFIFLALILALIHADYDFNLNLSFILRILFIFLSIYFGYKSNKLLLGKSTKMSIDKFAKARLVWNILGVFIIIIVWFYVGIRLNYKNHKIWEEYTICSFALNEIRDGLEKYKSSKGSLSGLTQDLSVICPYIRGASNNCEEHIKQFDEHRKSCKENSFALRILDKNKYEIQGRTRLHSNCNICITEISNHERDGRKIRMCMRNPQQECKH